MAIPTFGNPTYANVVYRGTPYRIVAHWEFDRGDPADATPLANYDEEPGDWGVVSGGASVAEIDTAQQVTGARSARIAYDGANAVDATNNTWGLIDLDLSRFVANVRPAQVNSRVRLTIQDAGANIIQIYFYESFNFIYARHGNGAGGNTNTVVGSYAANTWYLVEIEFDFTNNVFRVRIDGGAWSGWLNFFNDLPHASADTVLLNVTNGAGEGNYDDLEFLEPMTTLQYGTPTF